MTILLVINAIIFYYYAKNRSKEKGIDVLTIKKMENDEFEKFCIKNYTCYYFHDKTKFEDSDIDSISTVKKSYENILIYKISYNTLIGQTICVLDLIIWKDLLEFMKELDIWLYLALKIMMPLSI